MAKGNRTARRRLTYDRLTMEAGCPPKPEWMPSQADRYWDAVVRDVESTGLLTQVDGQAIAGLAVTLWRLDQTYQGIEHDGPRESVLHIQVLKYTQQLGLTPYARRLLPDAKRPDQKDELAEFLKLA